MDTVDVKTLQVGPSSLSESDLEEYKSIGASRHWPRTPFPIDEDLNARVILYDGDIELLRADAIVNPTNENLNQLSYVSHLAGPELSPYIRKKIRLCATGEVRVTPAFASNYQHIIHAVPPKYQAKYKTAAETALFHTYFRILETMIEKKIRTIVMPALVTSKCNLPMGDNCNLQLRIIRRILEKKRHEFDRIVIHVRDNMEHYLKPFYCYFPRTCMDEEIACYHFTGSLGGSNGEPVIPEREIRIKVVGKTEFSKMREDLDPNMLHGMNNNNNNNYSNNRNNSSLLGSSSPLGKYLTKGGLSQPASSNQRALQRRSVLTGCNLF